MSSWLKVAIDLVLSRIHKPVEQVLDSGTKVDGWRRPRGTSLELRRELEARQDQSQ